MWEIQRVEDFRTSMKIFERVLYERLKQVTEVNENQFGLMAGKSNTGAICIIRQQQEKN